MLTTRILRCPRGWTVLLLAAGFASGPAVAGHEPLPPVATFSIVAADTATGEWGVAVASRFLAVGSVVPYARAGVGAVATQAIADPEFGPRALDLLETGLSPARVIERLLADDQNREARQIGIVGPQGEGASFTGARCGAWAGGMGTPGVAVQGNILADPTVTERMSEVFQMTSGSLAERLLNALAAGERAGGDRRGKQSAALLVVRAQGGYGGGGDRYVDLRVDDHEDPVRELARLYALYARTRLPAVHTRLGDRAMARGEREEAEREYSRVIHLYQTAIRREPGDIQAKNGLAWFYARHRMNLDEALHLAREAKEISPDSWEVLDTLAEIFFARGQLREAHEFARKALVSDPENPYLRNQAGRFEEALRLEEER